MKILLSLLLLALFAGCAHNLDTSGVYAGDQTLYTTDLTIGTSYDIFHTFVTFEATNRASLPVAVSKAADNIRVNAPKWTATAVRLRQAYVVNPTPESRKSLSEAIAIIQAAITEAVGYLSAPPLKPVTDFVPTTSPVTAENLIYLVGNYSVPEFSHIQN